jgi:nucleoside-diphosphate-sugar epimerase
MKHSVVIGGAGFVGSWVVDEILKDSNGRVTIVDNLISSEKWNISTDPRVTFIEGSAADINVLKSIQDNVDFVYQLACFHGNQSSIVRPLDDFENGLKTTLVTLEWVKTFNPQARVIYSGAGCAVAEKTWNEPTAVEELESTSLSHDSPYSISKITGEMYCKYYSNQFGLNIVRVRFQNIYGPREILGAGIWRGTENTIWRNVIPTFIYKALNNYEIDIFAAENASRDFIYVEDVARAVVIAALAGENGSVYNIASGEEMIIGDLLKLIMNKTESKSIVNHQSKRSWDNSGRRLGDASKIFNNLGFKPEIPLSLGLDLTINWTLNNLDSIIKSITKHGKGQD